MPYFVKPKKTIIDFGNPLTKGLFIECSFSEGAGPQTRNAVRRVDGAFTGTFVWNDGLYGRQLRFSGTQGITFLNESSQDLSTGFALEAMVKWDNTGPNNTIASKRSSYSSTGIPFEVTRDQQLISFRIIGNSANLNTGSIISSGVWYHVVCTWDGATQAIYVNGSPVVSQARSGTVTNNSTDLTIGMLPGGGEKMSGDFTHLRIWKRGLNAVEVSQLYENPWRIYKTIPRVSMDILTSPIATARKLMMLGVG